jgi:hypothetical protein
VAYAEDRDKGKCGAAIRSNGHTHIVIGDTEQRLEALRVSGRHASNPEYPMSYGDAAKLNEIIRRDWGTRYRNVRTCECHACRERRDRDAEMIELCKSPPSSPKPAKVVGLFFEWFFWGK